jgi:hypothetical protein
MKIAGDLMNSLLIEKLFKFRSIAKHQGGAMATRMKDNVAITGTDAPAVASDGTEGRKTARSRRSLNVWESRE